MTPTQLNQVCKFEMALTPSQEVTARWTAGSFGHYSAKATVKRVNRASVRVTLTEAVTNAGTIVYPVGHEIVCPLLNGSGLDRWTHFNRVEPVGGYWAGMVREAFAGKAVA